MKQNFGKQSLYKFRNLILYKICKEQIFGKFIRNKFLLKFQNLFKFIQIYKEQI